MLGSCLLSALVLAWLGEDVRSQSIMRMTIEGTVNGDNVFLGPTTLIRVLHADSSIIRTISPYSSNASLFAVRLTYGDGFAEGEHILFRFVVSPRDSFVARTFGYALAFTPSNAEPPPIARVRLFRNHRPEFRRAIPDTVIKEGQFFRFRALAIDRDADTVRYRIVQAPAGATIDSITGMTSWRTDFESAGTYKVRLEAFDGYERVVSRVSTLVVLNVDRPPSFTHVPSDTTISEGDNLRLSFAAQDPDLDSLSFAVIEDSRKMATNAPGGDFEWTPTFGQAGVYRFRAVVSDGELTDTSHLVRVTVLHVNRPPRFLQQVLDTTISENQELRMKLDVVDPDGDAIRYGLISPPQGLTIAGDGIVIWRPSFDQAGQYEIRVTASDSLAESRASVTIHVRNTNRLPSAPHPLSPHDVDSARVVPGGASSLFRWSRSSDPDQDDTLRYALHLYSPDFDTTIENISDTACTIMFARNVRDKSAIRWTVSVFDGHDTVSSADTMTFMFVRGRAVLSDVASEPPKTFLLEQNFPNPFNPTTVLRYTLTERCFVKLSVYNMLGEQLKLLVSDEKDAGVYAVSFDATTWTSGVYMVKLEAHPLTGSRLHDFVSTKKMILVK